MALSARVRLWFVGMALFGMAGTAAAQAQAFPSKPMRVISVGAGGATDLWARTIAQKMTEELGQPAIVENHPGAANMIAAKVVASSAADGHTIGLGSNGSHALNVSLYSSMPYDPVADFTPITLVGHLGYVLIVRGDSPVTSLGDFVKFAANKPGGALIGSTNSTARLIGEMFRTRAGVNLVAVPYKVGSASLVDLVGGRIDAMIETITVAAPQAASGKVRALGVTSKERSPQLPAVPTFAESGYPGFSVTAWVAFFGPSGVPKDRVATLNTAIRRILAMPDVRTKLADSGLQVETSTPEGLADFVKSEIGRWGDAFKASGMDRIN